MNQYFKNLNKIEFVVTNACTGRCKHCSEGEHNACGESINAQIAVGAVMKPRSSNHMFRMQALEKEERIQAAMLEIRRRYGANAVLKGTNYMEGGTARERNGQIGGHRA